MAEDVADCVGTYEGGVEITAIVREEAGECVLRPKRSVAQPVGYRVSVFVESDDVRKRLLKFFRRRKYRL